MFGKYLKRTRKINKGFNTQSKIREIKAYGSNDIELNLFLFLLSPCFNFLNCYGNHVNNQVSARIQCQDLYRHCL